ncbi:hypothetical protein ACHAXS_008473 [Conticribra weissflogii]
MLHPDSFFSSGSKSTSITSPWERSAKLVKNTDVTNQYLDHIRSETVDPGLQLKTIEDELCGAIGKALGRQGEKILFAIREMTEENVKYRRHLEESSFRDALQSARRHNEARKRAIKARWELLVHRQCAGLVVDNHRIVHETFPISEKLPETIEEMKLLVQCVSVSQIGEKVKNHNEQPRKENFKGQLDWWQNFGRWK